MGVPGEHRAAWGSKNQGQTLGEWEAPTDGPGPRHLPSDWSLRLWSRPSSDRLVPCCHFIVLSVPQTELWETTLPPSPRVPRADGHAQHRAGAQRTCVKRSYVTIGDSAEAEEW